MEIRTLGDTDFEDIFQAFAEAFADYELQLNKTQLHTMLVRRGFDPSLSFAAFDSNRITAFTLNGKGIFNGLPTAYDTGTGTLPQYRGHGLATKIFEHSIPFLKEAGIEQYLLEVLQHNEKAISVYRKLGFAVRREFYYFGQENDKIYNGAKTAEHPYKIAPINIAEQQDVLESFCDFEPSWQNSFESIQRASGNFICRGAFTKDNKLAGYCVFEPTSGDITQIAVDTQYRRKGIASLLLSEIMRLNRTERIKVINTDISCNSIRKFFEAKNIILKGSQFEMVKQL